MRQLDVGGQFDRVQLSFGRNTTVDYVHMNSVKFGTLYLNVTTVSGMLDPALRSGSEDPITNNDADAFYSTVVMLNASVSMLGNGFQTIHLPRAETVRSMAITDNRDLKTISVAAVTVSDLQISKNGRETSAEFPRLTTVLGDGLGNTGRAVQSTWFSNLVSLRLPELRVVHPKAYSLFFEHNLFPDLHLPRLETANTTLRVNNNSVLVDFTLPRLSFVEKLEVAHNPRLLNLTANVLGRAGSIDLEGSFTNVELFSLHEVTGDFSVVGAPDMDCSWFDANFFQKVVKGSYRCEGNHTEPAVPRRPTWGGSTGSTDGGTGPGDGDGGGGAGGLSVGAKAGIGVGAGLSGAIALVLAALFFWRKKKQGGRGNAGPSGDGEHALSEVQEVGGKSLSSVSPVRSELDAKTAASGGPSEIMAEADSRALRGAELDTDPRHRAGTREELDGTAVRAGLPVAASRGVVELPG
ncbi:hypothetical protein B0H67DRAFT_590944 [Lasiosphaeris hirsuta]|uniref:Uncharacterized protein n=1 Tax=Lasiosphaeris hirsuta TaxID=260670 RepID=A0AA40DPI2_9PEZI|nr:hypothetical protein B0H67DRAFT_590944 [Lasiosphaeris hirsuta]